MSNTSNKTQARKKYDEKYPEKKKARIAAMFIHVGNNCVRHHWSFQPNHFRNIIELEKKHLNFVRCHLVYDQLNLCYRTLNGDLLDSRDKHERYINEKLEKFNLYLELNKNKAAGNRKRIKV